jgi:hypothetical protein
MRGIETYAEEAVKTYKVLSNMLARGCSVAHTVHFPLGGIESEGLIRDMYDLDSWLRRGSVSTLLSLPASRECFWRLVRTENPNLASECVGERAMFVPESIANSSKIRTVSGSVKDLIPSKIAPLSENLEMELAAKLFAEISEGYAIDMSYVPVLDRCSGDQVFCDTDPGNMRLIMIGASHTTKLVGGLAELGFSVVNLAKPGWILDENTGAEISLKLRQLNVGQNDVIIIDPMSNGIFCGTDERGNPVEPFKANGTWHIMGEMGIRSKNYAKKTLCEVKKMIEPVGSCKIMLISPLARYVTGKCCDEPGHLSNFADPDYFSDLAADLDKVEDLMKAWVQAQHMPGLLLAAHSVVDEPAALLTEMAVGGQPLWADADPVHACKGYYSAMTAAIATAIEEHGFMAGESIKRARLESVVVRSENSDTGPQSIRPQSWSSGTLQSRKRRGNGGQGRGGSAGPSRGQHRGWKRGFQRGGGGWRSRGFRGSRGYRF